MHLQSELTARLQSREVECRFDEIKGRLRKLVRTIPDGDRAAVAASVCHQAVIAYWRTRCQAHSVSLPLPPIPARIVELPLETLMLADSAGFLAADAAPALSAYLLGTLYTAAMAPADRSLRGAYYTPPALVQRLLATAETEGVQWGAVRVIDPSCGSGAFLVPVAERMAAALKGASPKDVLATIAQRLMGMELDPVAAWLAQVALEAAVLPLIVASNARLPLCVRADDALAAPCGADFDLVVGNPPYGRVALTPAQREQFSRSLFGHANLYGVFTDLALRHARPGGLVAYVTPTSFLGGQYFKALRRLLAAEAPPLSLDVVEARTGVFDDVQQETVLALYRRGGARGPVAVGRLTPEGVHATVGNVVLETDGAPWLLPREPAHAQLLEAMSRMPTRLSDLGYSVSTGPLVWNRHKGQLRESCLGDGVYPLVWAEAVAGGIFNLERPRRKHAPGFALLPSQTHLLTTVPCVLVQRTTAKEQGRRLMCAELPASALVSCGAVVVENHLNMVLPAANPVVPPAVLAAVLNSQVVDSAYRCISGSVAVSAYELQALPLPDASVMREIERRLQTDASGRAVEACLRGAYGLGSHT